jgi:PadR family transcriptional regulator, regulatory protein PadR
MLDGEAGNLVTQMRRGVLPYCVLAMLGDGERYGFELVRSLASVDGLVTGEGTIYPLLARLRRQELVQTTWRESDAGPPRRYYRLTQAGRTALAEFTGAWKPLRDSVDSLLESAADDATREKGTDADEYH